MPAQQQAVDVTCYAWDSTMITKLNRQIALNNYPIFPTRNYDAINDEEIFFYPKVQSNIILTSNSKSFKGHINALATEICNLITHLDSEYLIFLGDTKTAWLYQKNDYKPVAEAQKFFSDNKIGQKFNGALRVGKDSLITFLRHLSWMTRCNAALPYIYFTDKGQNIICTICQYGNLHLSFLNDKTESIIKEIRSASKLRLLTETTCFNRFGKTSRINGRQTMA